MYTNSAYLNNSLIDFKNTSQPLIVGSCGTYRLYRHPKLPTHRLFFASPFWTKLQNIFGHCCMSKLDKVAKHMASLEQTSRTALQTL